MQVVTKNHLMNFTEKLLKNDKTIKDALKNDLVNKQEFNKIIDIESQVNIFNKENIEIGKYWDVFENGGTIWKTGDEPKTSSDYWITELIPIKNGDVLRSSDTWFNFVYFDSNKEVTRCKTGGNQAEQSGDTFTIDGDLVAFIQLTYSSACSYDDLMITINNEIPSIYTPYSTGVSIKEAVLEVPLSKYVKKSEIDFEGKWSRKDVYINATDTQEEILVKMLDAVKHTNCDVYFETGEYNFTTIFDLMKSKYGYTTAYELPIGGNCKYYFQGSTLTATKTSTDSNVIGNESLLGCRRKSGSYELHDGTLICNDMVYCVHDEAQGELEPYVRKYENMVMQYNTTNPVSDLRKCIGGGTGLHGTVIIDSCVFLSDNNQDVSYHGHDKSDATQFRLTITNSYFSRKIQLANLSTNETGVAILSGNSFGSNCDTTSKWTIYEMNNTVRN